MAVTRIHHLNAASIRGMSILGQHLVCHVLLLETDASGLVLVDTGLGRQDYVDMSRRMGPDFARVYARPLIDPSLAAVAQITELGLDPRDVRHIVLTHLDPDHVGGLADFPAALVHVHATELAAAQRRDSFVSRRRYRPNVLFEHNPKWRTYRHGGDSWLGFEAVRGLDGLDDDIVLVPLFGHTEGHCGIAVDHGDRRLFHAGDAYFDAREIKLPTRTCGLGPELFQLAVTTERDERRANQNRLRALHAAHPEIDIFCAHSPFEYLDLVERSGAEPRGISPTRRWKPSNRKIGVGTPPASPRA